VGGKGGNLRRIIRSEAEHIHFLEVRARKRERSSKGGGNGEEKKRVSWGTCEQSGKEKKGVRGGIAFMGEKAGKTIINTSCTRIRPAKNENRQERPISHIRRGPTWRRFPTRKDDKKSH